MDPTVILAVAGKAVWTLVGLTLLVGMVYAFPILKRTRAVMRRLDDLSRVLDRRLDPILERVERITGDVDHISTSLRDDVEALGDAVQEGADAAERIARITERRITEIDSLLEVAQDEAEEAFLSTASLLRGLQSLRDRFGGRR